MNQKIEKVGVACVLVDPFLHTKVGKPIWLSKRLGEYEHGKYACPGGMVEPTDESDVLAIQREVLEETGIHIADLSRFKRSIVSHHPGGKSDITQWFVLELTYWWRETPHTTEPTKHGEWKLYTIEEAKNLPLMVSTNEVLNTL
jgi:8-oxo-dGTP pyrophosphatase MutT (NUDIX family)